MRRHLRNATLLNADDYPLLHVMVGSTLIEQ